MTYAATLRVVHIQPAGVQAHVRSMSQTRAISRMPSGRLITLQHTNDDRDLSMSVLVAVVYVTRKRLDQ